MANPLVPQGTLNRLLGSVVFTSYPGLNVTASFLGKEGIGLTFDGPITSPLETMTGIVDSPEPYQRVSVTIHMLKSQALANAFKNQIETYSVVGDATVRLDTKTLGPYQLSNTMLYNVNPLRSNGMDPEWVLSLTGIYYINSALWNM